MTGLAVKANINGNAIAGRYLGISSSGESTSVVIVASLTGIIYELDLNQVTFLPLEPAVLIRPENGSYDTILGQVEFELKGDRPQTYVRNRHDDWFSSVTGSEEEKQSLIKLAAEAIRRARQI